MWPRMFSHCAGVLVLVCVGLVSRFSAGVGVQKIVQQPRLPSVRWRSDGRCGEGFPLADNTPSECDPLGERPCCSDYGYCGISASHCTCRGCIDYRNQIALCYLRLEGEEGIFESPNYPLPYPANQDCKYDIVRASENACGVKITVEDMDIPTGNNSEVCTKDWIAVESCVPEGGARLCGNDTGTTYQYNFQPGAVALRLVFHTDAEESGRGFRFHYKMVNECAGFFRNVQASTIPGTGGALCYTKISEPSGTINTPYHPKKYPENLDCVYEFARKTQSVCGIRMKTTTFDLEPPLQTPFGGACTDYFHMPACGFLCGKVDFTWIARYQPGATSIQFHFHSDETVGQSGFLISFEQVTEC